MCVCACVRAHESPSAAEFETDGESSCLDAIDQNLVFLSSHTHTRLPPLLPTFPSFPLSLFRFLSESISTSHTHSFCGRQTKQPAIMKWHCIIANTAVCLNELERKQAASLLCFLIIYYKQSIGEDRRKGVRGGEREGRGQRRTEGDGKR